MESGMSSVLEALMSKLDTPALERIASAAGVNAGSASNAVQTSVATVLGALTRGASNSQTATALHGLLNSPEGEAHHGIMDDVIGFVGKMAGGQTTMTNPLTAILGANAQNTMQQQVSSGAGISGDSASKMISMIAPMVLGALGQAQKNGAMDLGKFQQFLGTERQGLMNAVPSVMNGLGGMLDQDGDGDFDVSDIAKLGGKFFGGQKG